MHDQSSITPKDLIAYPGVFIDFGHTYTKRHDPRQSPHLSRFRTRRNATHLAVVRETLCHAASPDYEIAPTDRGRISLSQQPWRLQGETQLNQAHAPTVSTPQRLLGSLGVEIISISIIPGGRRGRHWILRRPKLDSFGSAHRPGSPPGSNDTCAHSRKNSWLRRSSFQKVPYLIKRPLPVPTAGPGTTEFIRTKIFKITQRIRHGSPALAEAVPRRHEPYLNGAVGLAGSALKRYSRGW